MVIERFVSVSACHVGDLSLGEHLLVWGTRYWARCQRRQLNPYGVLQRTFALAGAAHAMPMLDAFLAILALGARRPVDIRDHACQTLSPDELALVCSVARRQRHDNTLSQAFVAETIRMPEALSGGEALGLLASRLVEAGHTLPLRACGIPRYAAAPSSNTFAPTLH